MQLRDDRADVRLGVICGGVTLRPESAVAWLRKWSSLPCEKVRTSGELVGLLRQARHHLGEADAGQGGLDRAERAANLGRGIGLGVERVDVRDAAGHPEDDDRLGPGGA